MLARGVLIGTHALKIYRDTTLNHALMTLASAQASLFMRYWRTDTQYNRKTQNASCFILKI
ncbi:hypothetical protein VR7878_03347 [Vibrio ruber DSM 16370]|uniref:Uncharacterized protein n=1 Tax=Vibrio ruber (strain DSM 16370 / JCM 11486 / BCRC 17186 / CECT 7878 / LMG 23124 / VR1) TaxID=1123498 RepID=A0A1R4LS18_VIBR1|nr:hypothetical protein VR7878_03347 [Vibrio ruber DSM 16370]